MTDLATIDNFSTAKGSDNILSEVDTDSGIILFPWSIRQIENEVKIPSPFFTDQFAFFRDSFRKILCLKRPHLHFNLNPSFQGVKRDHVAFDRIGPFVKMNTAVFAKLDCRNNLIFDNASIFISFADGKDSIAGHLGSKPRVRSNFSIREVMQGNTVPTPMLHHKRNKAIASCME